MRWIRLLLGILALCFITLSTINSFGAQREDFELISEDHPLYQQLMRAAVTWKDALLSRQIDVLVSFALPEYRKYVSSYLRDQKSDLYSFLYNEGYGKKSIYEILKKAKKLRIVIVKHKRLQEFGHGTDFYYYDEARLKVHFPLTNQKERSLLDEGKMFKIFFFEEKGSWYTSYEFFEDTQNQESEKK
jgi:hypothetical protein